MTEFHPIYIRCASGNNAHTDCLVRRHGDLVEIIGHPSMHLTADDAQTLVGAILCAAEKDESCSEENIAILRSRIAMALHVPIMADSLSRELLESAVKTLREADLSLRYWTKSARRWKDLYEQEKALSAAEIGDGK